MPPANRRQKLHEQRLQSVRTRNTVAAVLLLVTLVAAFLLARWMIPESRTRIHLSVNWINHSGIRKIPFAEASCQRVQSAFSETLRQSATSVGPEIQRIDGKESQLKIVTNDIQPDDVLVVYLNGHLVDSRSRPSVLATGTEPEVDSGDEIYWLGPEAGNVEKKLSKLLQEIDAAPAKRKIVMLDGGRYSWSPVWTGREVNQWPSGLAAKLESNAWGLSDDFWVITSHDDGEISNVSTPLQTSLFGLSIEEALRALASDRPDKLSVPELYKRIKNHTATYAQNFKDQSLQNPVMLRSKVGRVDDQASGISQPVLMPWNHSFVGKQIDEENPQDKGQPFRWQDFVNGETDEFGRWLLDDQNIAALPVQTIERLEQFLEFGDLVSTWRGTEIQQFQQYQDRVAQTQRTDQPFTFIDPQQLGDKQQTVQQFRESMLHLALLMRYRAQFRHLNDESFQMVASKPLNGLRPVAVTDLMLTENASVPMLGNWKPRIDQVLLDHRQLLGRVENQLRDDGGRPLTPMQAEILGVLSQRYLPLLRMAIDKIQPPGDDDEKVDLSTRQPTMTLEPKASVDRFNPVGAPTQIQPSAGMIALASAGRGESMNLFVIDDVSDTATRFRTVAAGEEFQTLEMGVVPNIQWQAIQPSIAITAASPQPFMVGPVYLKRVPLTVSTAAIGGVDLAVRAIDTDPLPGLRFGLNRKFSDVRSLTELKGADQPFRKTESFDLYLQYPVLDPSAIGKSVSFELTATERVGNADRRAVSTQFPFSIEVTADAEFVVVATRKIGNRNRDANSAKLLRWDAGFSNRDFDPLTMATLANVRSPFEFSLRNNSQSPRKFSARLYRVNSFPQSIRTDRLSADRADYEQLGSWLDYVQQKTNLKGKPVFEQPEFSLLGAATVNSSAGTDTPIKFQPFLSDAAEPPTEIGEVEGQRIEHGALLLLYTDAADETEFENRRPDWFQWIRFAPLEPANATRPKDARLKIKSDLTDVFSPTEMTNLQNQLAPGVDPEQIAKLTIVSPQTRQRREHATKTLQLKELLQGDPEFSFANTPGFLILDVLGVPAYMTYQTNGTSLTATGLRSQLTGIRLADFPDHWTVYPASWSFASRAQAEQKWLAGRASEVQNIYVRIDPAVDTGTGTGGATAEIFLPFRNDDVLLSQPDDFWIRWKGGLQNTRYWPNLRQHQIAVGPAGLESWTRVAAHEISLSDIGGQQLEIGRADQPDAALGRWRFITRSPGTRPSLTASQTSLYNTLSDFGAAKITLDLSAIDPPISLDQVTLQLDELEIEPAAVSRFLNQHRSSGDEDQRFKFSLLQLRSLAGNPPARKRTRIVAGVTNFFGEKTSRTVELAISAKPKPKAPPKPVSVVVNLAGTGESSLNLHSISGIRINGTPMPLGAVVPVAGGSVRVVGASDSTTLKVTGLLPGKYSINAEALIKREGAAQATPASGRISGIQIDKNGQVIDLTID